MGRPRKYADKQSAMISFRVTEAELELLTRAARFVGANRSEWMAEVLILKARELLEIRP